MDANTAVYMGMGPTLLSRQPATPPDKIPRDDEDWESIFQHLESRLGMLRSWRYSWWSHWARLAEYFLPRRYHWVIVANKMWKGSNLNDAIIDSNGLQAVRTCSAGMWSGFTNPARDWVELHFNVRGVEPDADAKDWLEDTTERLYDVLAGSNFYTTMAQAFEDLTVFGAAPPIIYEDFADVIRIYLPCAGEYYLACGARLSTDTLYREFTLTVAQIVEMFGFDNCPHEVQLLWQQGGASLDQEKIIGHAIEPNFALSRKGARTAEIRVVPGIFTFREVYWLRGIQTQRPLSKRGFHKQPFLGMLWSRVSNDPYGRSPCMDALGDNKQVQRETLRKAEFIEKGVRPPMGADAKLKNEPASILPAQITYMDTGGGKNQFFPLFETQPQWLPALTQDIDKVNARIDKCLFVDVFMAITQMEGVQPRNELELTKRDLERLQKLGPVIDLVKGELRVGIERILDIMIRRNLVKPMPPSMKGQAPRIEFDSIDRIAQRAARAVAMKDTFAMGGSLSSAAKAASLPDPLRTMKLDESFQEYGKITNYPTHLWYSKDEVAQHDAARAKAMAQQQAPAQAMAAVTAAKTLSETQLPGGNTALGSLIGGAQQ